MINLVKKYYFLSFQEKIIVFKIVVLKLFMLFFFKILKFPKLLELHRFLLSKNKTQSYLSPQRLHYLYKKTDIYLPKATCLLDCICLKILMNNQGHNVYIQNGVSFKKDKISGHSWIVFKNKPILSDNENIAEYKNSFTIN